jgi:hypothetical protein
MKKARSMISLLMKYLTANDLKGVSPNGSSAKLPRWEQDVKVGGIGGFMIVRLEI